MSKSTKLPPEYIGKAELYGHIEKGLKHIVYELSIEDLEERKAKAKIFDSAIQAAAYIGCDTETIFRNRLPKKKVKGISGKYFAVRIYKEPK